MRDENGFKMHTQSESHVRQMLLIGEDPKKYIEGYSNQFQKDFINLLRTSHGEKQVQMNHFYQEYISNKEHIHMNASKWPSLTEFAKHLGREGICRVEETDKGIHIAWVDNSPEALRRQDAIRKKERQDRGDEEREQALIKEQIKKAKMDAEARNGGNEADEAEGLLKREGDEKIKLSFGSRSAISKADSPVQAVNQKTEGEIDPGVVVEIDNAGIADASEAAQSSASAITALGKVSLKMGFSNKPKNVFAAAKKNALGGKKAVAIEQPKKISEAERIMREEMERKKRGGSSFSGGPSHKKQRF